MTLEKRDIPARIDHVLETHHALLHKELPRIAAAAADSGAPEFQEVWSEFSGFVAEHLMKEEHMLFPTAKAMVAGEDVYVTNLDGPMNQMASEHEQIHALCDRVRASLEVGDGAAGERDAVLALLADLAVHAGLEDDELFPAISALAEEAAVAQEQREVAARASMADKIREMEDARPTHEGKRARLKKALGGLFGR